MADKPAAKILLVAGGTGGDTDPKVFEQMLALNLRSTPS